MQTTSVPAASLKPGPIQHAQLTEQQIERIKLLKETLAEVDNSSLKHGSIISDAIQIPTKSWQLGACGNRLYQILHSTFLVT